MVSEESLKNLELGKKITTENAREYALKSVESRKKNKTMRETLEEMLKCPNDDTMTWQEAILKSAVIKAKAGDIKAMEFIRDTIGQKPVDNINTTATTITRYITQEETQETNKHIDDVINGTR